MFTTEFKNRIMNSIFHGTSETLPENYYIGMSTTAPSADGTGVTEPVTGSYARVLVSSFAASNNGRVINNGIIELPKSTDSWGTITHAVLFDGAGSDASVLWYKELANRQTIGADTTMVFQPGELWFLLSDE